jgi:hypothetical protein
MMTSNRSQTTESWSISLTSDRVAYVRGRIYTMRTANALLDALQTIKPLIPPAAVKYEIDGDWAE